jgi:hypothetical protein
MTITVPVAGTELSVAGFGKPVADAVNALPVGCIAYKRGTGDFSYGGSETSLVNGTCNFSVNMVATRRYRLGLDLPIVSAGTSSGWSIWAKMNGVTQWLWTGTVGSSTQTFQLITPPTVFGLGANVAVSFTISAVGTNITVNGFNWRNPQSYIEDCGGLVP